MFERISSSIPKDESGIGQPYNLVTIHLMNILFKLTNFGMFFFTNPLFHTKVNTPAHSKVEKLLIDVTEIPLCLVRDGLIMLGSLN